MTPASRSPVTIRDVWKLVPDVDCKGLCAPACRAIGMYQAERDIVTERMPDFPTAEEGVILNADPAYRCPALVLGRCIIHKDRPTICRLWGVDERLKCPHGCVPKDGWLPKERGSAIMDAAREIGGDPV